MNRHAATGRAPRRRPPLSVWLAASCWMLGIVILLYPTAAAWMSQVNQTSLVGVYERDVEHAEPKAATQLQAARAYNEELSSGALLEAGKNVAVGAGESRSTENLYRKLLVTESGVMARLRIPAIDVDLPIYHGTAEDTLLRGLGHLEGTSLPVGGESTRSVITGHRGLASARMFTDLNKLKQGDVFTIETFGEVLSYRVRDVVVVQPDKTETLHQEAGEDLVTLITCTPLGVNSHRILVTGERITPTPQHDLDAAGKSSGLPGFPWWSLALGGGLLLGVGYLLWASRPQRERRGGSGPRSRHRDAAAAPAPEPVEAAATPPAP